MTLRHVVLFRFNPDADVKRVETAFAALAGQITEIQSLEWGTNNSPEGKDNGFTHCFSAGFANAAARDAYLVHPTHQAFSALARPNLAEVLVIDYDVNDVKR
jgi:hypothetical protein